MLLCNREVIIINTQFKKGVLELLVLLIVENEDKYGYEMVEEVSKVVDVNEGTIYPILKRLTNENYFETYLKARPDIITSPEELTRLFTNESMISLMRDFAIKDPMRP